MKMEGGKKSEVKGRSRKEREGKRFLERRRKGRERGKRVS